METLVSLCELLARLKTDIWYIGVISCSALAEAVSIATTLGVHLDTSSHRQPYTFLSAQIRNRLFAHLFTLDKVTSIFSGRPPLLSGRYCSAALPLDLGDHSLLESAHNSSTLLGTLDQNGWNTQGRVYSATLLRARAMMAYVRDEVLELVLGTGQELPIENLM